MQSRVIMSGEPQVFNDVAEVVKQPGGTFYDVDGEGNVPQAPRRRAVADAALR